MHEAVVVGLLGPFVDETAGPGGHGGAVEGGDFVEGAGFGLDATLVRLLAGFSMVWT